MSVYSDDDPEHEGPIPIFAKRATANDDRCDDEYGGQRCVRVKGHPGNHLATWESTVPMSGSYSLASLPVLAWLTCVARSCSEV